MSASFGSSGRKSWLATLTLFVLPLLASSALADIDRSLYMTTDELKPGMKGYGKTVLSGTNIQTFNVEVISVVHNSFYAKQDMILVRCSGLNLENTGVIGGMSGSPCYIRDDQGRERLIGLVLRLGHVLALRILRRLLVGQRRARRERERGRHGDRSQDEG